MHKVGFIYQKKENIYPYIIASITECQTGQLLFFLTTNTANGIASAFGTGTNRISAIPDERNTLTMTKRDPLWISYILCELPCSEKNSWPNWSIHFSLDIAFVKYRKRSISWSSLPTLYANNEKWKVVYVMISWKIIGADVTNSLEWFLLPPPFQLSEYKVFYEVMCWLSGSLTCRLRNVMRSPPARRSREFNHCWLIFGSS